MKRSSVVHILRSEGKGWKHYSIIRDNSVTILDMVPALICGWNVLDRDEPLAV